jgi:hypothetical protein
MIVSARRGPEITRFAGEEGDDEERVIFLSLVSSVVVAAPLSL